MSNTAVILQPANKNDGYVLANFLIEHGRLPFITDDVKPWHYRGWLLPYRMGAEMHPQVAARYGYVMHALEIGKLPDEPIPQITFYGEHETAVRPGMKQLEQMMKIVEYTSSSWNAIQDICSWLGFALGVTSEISTLAEDVQEKLYRMFNLEPWLLCPTDYLGQYLCEMNHNRAGGFFPTPMHVCTMMTDMTFPKDTDCRHLTTMDPCVGTGRFLMTASNYSMRLFGQDINGLAVLVTKINLALYAPWFYIKDSFWPKEEPVAQLTPWPPSKDAPAAADRQDSVKKFTTLIEQPMLFDF